MKEAGPPGVAMARHWYLTGLCSERPFTLQLPHEGHLHVECSHVAGLVCNWHSTVLGTGDSH